MAQIRIKEGSVEVDLWSRDTWVPANAAYPEAWQDEPFEPVIIQFADANQRPFGNVYTFDSGVLRTGFWNQKTVLLLVAGIIAGYLIRFLVG